jgi:3-hydroxy acid dehydrogenase / malonic semialdehyde reductase
MVSTQAGSNVILIARRADALKAVSEACITAHKESGLQQGGRFAIVQMDVSQKDQVAVLWDKVPQDLRNVDILGTLLEFEAPATRFSFVTLQ